MAFLLSPLASSAEGASEGGSAAGAPEPAAETFDPARLEIHYVAADARSKTATSFFIVKPDP